MWDLIVSVPDDHCLSFTLLPSVGKELSPWLFSCAVFYCHLNCKCPFSVWCLG